eukprot:12199799-Ditylum_brightwellii.AAC.1
MMKITPSNLKNAYHDGDKLFDYHKKQLLCLLANFTLTADLCFKIGGQLKVDELLMGQLADALGAIYLGYTTLHHCSCHCGIEGLDATTEHALLHLRVEAQTSLNEVSDNFPGPLGELASMVMKIGCFPIGNLSQLYWQQMLGCVSMEKHVTEEGEEDIIYGCSWRGVC